MCGIVGLIDPASGASEDELLATVGALADTVAHRGPDAAGAWCDHEGGVAFGHRRLSIIDVTDAGAQPMGSHDGRWVITFNGEIYNHLDLMADLRTEGCTFRGHSDTEVLIEAVAHWGVRATLERIEGMFAFALWDRAEHRLTLARDRIGEKPLFCGRAGTAVVFASSLDAFRAHPRFDATISPDALTAMLRFKYVPSPLSIYRDVEKVPSGTYVEIDRSGSVAEPVPYWSYADVVSAGAATPFEGTRAEATDLLEDLVRSSVRNRMISDVPIGAFLSGGIDSSAVVALMVESSPATVQTFTIGSEDAQYDEARDAALVANHLGTRHQQLVVSGREAIAAVDALPRIYDEPFGDSSQIPTYLVSKLARGSVTVSLSGDGGDELFGGYNRHRWLPAIHRRSRHVPAGARRSLASVVERIGPLRIDRAAKVIPARVRPRQAGLKAEKIANVAALDDVAAMYLRTVSHWPDPARAVRSGHDPLVLASDPSAWPRLDDHTEQMMAVDLLTYLPDDILAKVDRATMAVGLEGRMPFLDRRIVEFAATLPPDLRHAGQPKQLLRDVLYRRVPRELLERPKAGFGIPLDSWLRGPLRAWGDELLSDACGEQHLHLDIVRATWSDHQRGHHNHGYRLWDVLMFLAWLDARRTP